MADDIRPVNSASPNEAVHDLTSDLKKGEKTRDGDVVGWNFSGRKTLVKGPLTENGETIVTYTLQAPKASGIFGKQDYPNLRPMDGKKEREAVHAMFDEIETAAKFKFVELPAEKASEADIRFFRHDGKEIQGGASWESLDDNGRTVRDIVMSNGHTTDRYRLLHEVLHLLGEGHTGLAKSQDLPSNPGEAGGKDPLYNSDLTVMSYNKPHYDLYMPLVMKHWGVQNMDFAEAGKIMDKRHASPGAADVETLKRLYGGREETAPKTFTADDLRESKYLDTPLPASLDIDSGRRGELTIKTGRAPGEGFSKIEGIISDQNDKTPVWVSSFLTGSTRLQDVRSAKDSGVILNVTGDPELENRLQGGRLNDSFTPRGGKTPEDGGDVMAGRGGADRFIFDDKSGFGNVITDWDAGKDILELKIAAETSVELRRREDYPFDGGRHAGTELLAKNAAGLPVASLFMVGATPEQVKAQIREPWERENKHPITVIEDTAPATSQPAVQAPPTPSSKSPGMKK